ncbi:MAG: Bpu10I family restriction endonuclease [Firmicutes bacterium]|nr:Bpu10I family restriction endonuclease [Bacillota bacterium]
MPRGTHGEKVVAARESDKLPVADQERLDEAISKYDKWIQDLESADGVTLDELIENMVTLLNDYKYYIDVDVIFDSTEEFLYRQKGQLKLDNTVMEEFLPIFVRKCLVKEFGHCDLNIGSQTATFSSAYFASSLSNPGIGGELSIKTKDQDFSMSRPLYLRSSYSRDFRAGSTKEVTTHLGYVMAELKTNLDKTMFQEASATAHDVKLAVTGSKYYLLCDFLDMTPISTTTTDIDEILIVRKAKRISSNIRKSFSTYAGRQQYREWYTEYLKTNPYAPDMFKRFIEHIISQMRNEDLIEESVLQLGYF